MKKKIFFDIDSTLINSKRVEIIIMEKVAKLLGRDINEVNQVEQEYMKSLDYKNDFYPKDLARFMATKWGVNADELEKLFFDNEIFADSLYEETIAVLEALKPKHSLGIYSEGYDDFQRFKLKTTGIFQYFESGLINIKRRKKDAELVKSFGEITIVDDTIEVINFLNDFKNVDLRWINRTTKESNPGIKTIFSLRELIDEIK